MARYKCWAAKNEAHLAATPLVLRSRALPYFARDKPLLQLQLQLSYGGEMHSHSHPSIPST